MDACRPFRIQWLDGANDPHHAARCEACARWARVAELASESLKGLARLPAPPDLESAVARELAGDRVPRIERVLQSLVRRSAPKELDERVSAFKFASPVSEPEPKVHVLRALDVQPAPEVLARLVDEELQAPERHRVERLAGSLERLSAPQDLEARVDARVRRQAIRRLILIPAATLAAAAWMLWFSLRSGPEPRARRFEVVEASTLEGLNGIALVLSETVSGPARTGPQ
jgi:hypothetical protein